MFTAIKILLSSGKIPDFFSKYWSLIAVAIITAVLSYGMHSCQMMKADKAKEDAVAAEALKQQNECMAAKVFTTELSNEYIKGLEGDITAIDSRYNSLILHSSAEGTPFCIPIAGTGRGVDAAGTGGAAVAGSDGINAQALYRIAYDGDKRLARKDRKLKACQKHAEEVRKIGFSCK